MLNTQAGERGATKLSGPQLESSPRRLSAQSWTSWVHSGLLTESKKGEKRTKTCTELREKDNSSVSFLFAYVYAFSIFAALKTDHL